VSHVSYREQRCVCVCVYVCVCVCVCMCLYVCQFAAEKNMPFSFRSNSKSNNQLTRSLLLILHLCPSSSLEVKSLAKRVQTSQYYQLSGRHAGTWNFDWGNSNVKSKCHGEQLKIHDVPSKIRERKKKTAVRR